MIDYFLPSAAGRVELENFSMGSKISSEVFFGFFFEDRKTAKHAALAVAERWFPKTEAVEKSEGCIVLFGILPGAVPRASADEESSIAIHGPKVVPGIYQCG